jgi:hypothetical protein
MVERDTPVERRREGGGAAVSYSLPTTNAKVLALLRPRLAAAAMVLDIGAGEGYLARRVHAAIVEGGHPARLEACRCRTAAWTWPTRWRS